jgi:hypothetical protein
MSPASGRFRVELTTRQLLVAILFVAIFAMAMRQPADTDTWWHLKTGQLIWERGQWLHTDPFSHTVAGQPVLYPQLAQALLWPVYETTGLRGLAFLLATTVTGAFVFVYIQCAGRPYVAAFATLLAAVASSVIWVMRPHLLTLLLASILAYLLHRYKQSANARWLWPIPLLITLWVNSHGGFVVAFILMGCYLVGETLNRFTCSTLTPYRIRPLLTVMAVSVPAILLNPNTVEMVPYALQTIRIGALQDFIQEWASPDFHSLQFHPFIWLLLLTLLAMGLSRERADWSDLALIGIFGYMGFVAARNIALFALVVPPVLSRHTVSALDDLATENPRLSWLGALTHTLSPRPGHTQIVINTLLLLLVVLSAGAKIGTELVSMEDPAAWGTELPLAAVGYLQKHDLPGKMFNTYNWGGYLLWSLYPKDLVFVDGRTDLYAFNSHVLEDYVKVHWLRPGWRQVLDDYQIGYVITENTGLLDVTLAGTEGWDLVHQDDVAVIYRRAEETP